MTKKRAPANGIRLAFKPYVGFAYYQDGILKEVIRHDEIHVGDRTFYRPVWSLGCFDCGKRFQIVSQNHSLPKQKYCKTCRANYGVFGKKARGASWHERNGVRDEPSLPDLVDPMVRIDRLEGLLRDIEDC